MGTTSLSPVAEPAAPPNGPSKSPSFLKRRTRWLIGAVLIIAACALGYHWAFGKAKVHYATAAVERGDIESTVVAAGVLQPINYVDVGAQTSGRSEEHT